MPNFTPNYNLEKPLGTEYYNVGVSNSNADKIDTSLKDVDDRKTDKNKIVVFAKDFGVKADYNLNTGVGTDDTAALQAALNFARNQAGIEIVLPPGRMKITRSLTLTTSFAKITGQGFATEIVYDGLPYNSSTNPNGDAVLKIDNSGSSIPRIIIEKVSFHGGDKTLWAVYANASSGVTFRDVRFRRAFGLFRAINCPLMNVQNCVFEYNTPKKPEAVTQANWNVVKNAGIIHIQECHAFVFDQYFVYGAGHDEAEPLRSVFYISSVVSSRLIGGVIERDAQYLAGTQADDRQAVRQVFYLTNLVRNVEIENLYTEHINALNLLASLSVSNFNISVNNLYVHLSSYYYYLFNIVNGGNFKLGNTYIWGTYMSNSTLVFVPEDSLFNPIAGRIVWYKGKKGGVHNRRVIDGKTYADIESLDNGLAITNGRVVSDGNKFLRVTEGLEVTQGSDSIGSFIAVSNGAITNHEGCNLEVGLPLTDTVKIGWILRPNLIADGNYRVCIDVYGGVWTENTNAPKSDIIGKAILATFSVDSSLSIVNLVSNRNLFKGTYSNDVVNKVVYSTTIPTFGFWTKGDRLVNVLGNEDVASGAVCIASGNPGVWKALPNL